MPCPVCIQKGYKSDIAYWRHYEDGGDIYIGSDGFLLCSKCGRRSHIRYWRYKCQQHSYGQIRRLIKCIYDILIQCFNDSDGVYAIALMEYIECENLPLTEMFNKVNQFVIDYAMNKYGGLIEVPHTDYTTYDPDFCLYKTE